MFEALITTALLTGVFFFYQRSKSQAESLDEPVMQTALLEHFVTSLNKINSVAFIIDVDTADFVFVNHCAIQQLGYSRDELLGRSIDELTVQGVKNSLRDRCKELLDSKDDCQFFDTMLRNKNGQGLAFEVFLQRVSANEECFLVVIMKELAESKRIEKLQHQLIATVSHELRTPLTSIKGSLGLLTREDLESLPEKTRFLIDVAQKNSDRLMSLINDILDLEKVRYLGGNFLKQNISLAEVLKESLESMLPYAKEYKVTLVLENIDQDASVYADGQRMEQVINNLLSNAIKSSPENGLVHVNLQTIGNNARVNVIDEGEGISEAMQSRVFEPFAQSGEAENAGKGTGLGLPIARTIVEGHGGTIDFTTELGAGTRFYFELPLAEVAGKKEKRPEAVEV